MRSRTAFGGNHYVLIPNSPLAFVSIAGNASVFLKKVALLAADGYWRVNDREALNDVYRADSPLVVPVEEMAVFEAQCGARRRFAVWQDPLKRIIVTHQAFRDNVAQRPHVSMFGLQDTGSTRRFRGYCEWEWSKSDPLTQDERLRAAADHVDFATLHDVVDISDLNDFLRGHGLDFSATDQPLTPEPDSDLLEYGFITRVREVYQRDYALAPGSKHASPNEGRS